MRIDHVGFGVVLGRTRRSSRLAAETRCGWWKLLDEGLQRSRQKLKDKERDKALQRGRAASPPRPTRLRLQPSTPTSATTGLPTFQLRQDAGGQGNTACYMLYAYTRIRSNRQDGGGWTEDQLAAARAQGSGWRREGQARQAAAQGFAEVVAKMSDDLLLHSLAEFMYEVANTFEFYECCAERRTRR